MSRHTARAFAGVMALAALFATGCTQPPGDPGGRNSDAPPPVGAGTGPESSALGLVNLWRVSGVPEEEVDTWLRLDAGSFQLWRDCGMIDGSWGATETLFLASIYGASGDCVAQERIPKVEWLGAVTGYRSADAGWELTDAGGGVVATLTVDGAPDPIPTAATLYTEPPEITDSVRELMRKPVPLPTELDPVTAATLVGKWTPVDFVPSPDPSRSTDPHALFAGDGTWSGSDGCNAAEGRWAVDPAGALLATVGPMTQIGCEGAPVPTWVAIARLAGFDGELLSLLDLDGSEIARLERG